MMLLWPILQHGEDEYVGPPGSLSLDAPRRTPPRNLRSIPPQRDAPGDSDPPASTT